MGFFRFGIMAASSLTRAPRPVCEGMIAPNKSVLKPQTSEKWGPPQLGRAGRSGAAGDVEPALQVMLP